MLQYPSIKPWRDSPKGEHCIAFKKYDGSNLRWEYSPKKGWSKMGTRRQMFDSSTPLYSQSIELFNDTMAAAIVERVNDIHGRKVERITAFTEFFGPSSFAGSHDHDEAKELRLFDVFVFKKGFIPPRQFIKAFEQYSWAAEVIYEGNMNAEFIADVRDGKYPVDEGVICKGADWMAKIKCIAYLDKLRSQNPALWETEKHE